MTSETEPATILPWDTDFFGFCIGRVRDSRLTTNSLEAILQWNDDRHIRCLYFSADATCDKTLALAHQGDFQFVDMRVDLSLVLEPAAAPAAIHRENIRPGHLADLAPLQAIARRSHHDTRFFKDRHFPVIRAEALYAEWIRRDLELHRVFVVSSPTHPELPIGYITCLVDSAKRQGRIGLIAVADGHQGKGLGRALVLAGLDFFRSAGCCQVNVATQSANIPAQRLYQAEGFRTCESSVWFHRWSPAEEGSA